MAYIRKTPLPVEDTTAPVTAYTALSVQQINDTRLYQFVDIKLDKDDNVISVTRSGPLEYHMAVQAAKIRASYVWTGLEK